MQTNQLTRWCLDISLTVLLAGFFSAPALCQSPVSFTRDVAPILTTHCYACHGPDEDQREADLRLDSRQMATAPQETGVAPIVPGNSADSEVLRRVIADDETRMPPADHGKRLTKDQVGIIQRWIDEGANWELHWAFQPLDRRPPPSVGNAAWVRNEIDRFVLAGLHRAELTPAKPADHLTLLRRAYFDLLGLPPTLEQIRLFSNDRDADAFTRLIDELLASPSYGESWGRHWLDVARYGDSNGGDENHAYPLAHRYRDYVIEVLNEDLPYNQFIEQQLAGDLLEAEADERVQRQRIAGTGYLAIGMKILAEQDPVKKRADMVDEQIDTFGRTFLGLSLGCARCHDHKFDPIPTKDYYALAGIFHSTEVADRALPSQQFEAHLARYERQQQSLQKKINALQTRLQSLPGTAAIVREAESFDRGNVIVDNKQYGEGIGIISDPGGQLNFAEYDIEIKKAGVYLIQLRYAAAASRPGQLIVNGKTIKEEAIQGVTGSWTPESQTWFSESTVTLRGGTNVVRVQSKPLMSHIDKLRLLRGSEEVREVAQLGALEKELKELTSKRPTPDLVMAVMDGDVKNVKLHVRGSHLQLGEEVARGFIAILDGSTGTIPEQGSGRLELARWLTTDEAAARLTSRVIVNRIWHWHFGRGLVSTPDDFGIRGAPPTHPQLLDFLAVRLIESGWSWKAIHRLIMNSATYQVGGGKSDSQDADALWRLYGRRTKQRLQAEAIRDALLTHSGRRVDQLGNAGMIVRSQDPSPEHMADNLKKYQTSPRRSVYLPVVRSNVYEFLTLFDFPNASTPVGRRDQTTLPTQALWMMNSPMMIQFSHEVAQPFAQMKQREAAIRGLYLMLFCRQATDVEVEAGTRFLKQLANDDSIGKDAQRGWTAYCQVLLCSNEFLYLD